MDNTNMRIFTFYKLVLAGGLLLVLISIIGRATAYKPVVIFHGMFDHKNSLFPLRDRIIQKHKGTNVTVINKLHRWRSMMPMPFQVATFQETIRGIIKDNPGGIHLIGYSQGGLIARAVLESMPDHNVDTFISLSAPQGGQYGDQFLKLYFPTYVKEHAWKIFYRESGQHISIGNYWRDPNHLQEYYNHSTFLPLIDNEITSKKSKQYKNNFLRTRKLVLIGGPDDGLISPWESSQFGCYKTEDEVMPMEERDVYMNDLFGLKTLDEANKIIKLTVPGVHHLEWHKTLKVIDNYILPFLD